MHSSPQSESALQTAPASVDQAPRRRDDVTYQVITIAAMLLVLVTVWVF
ncbi:MAG TPA: hypothetical protein VHZ28_07800 [Terracidiphilus sp.]|jgi:hypothetical protein|nr:hypothetical protein [Terracidiphilus sp.]